MTDHPENARVAGRVLRETEIPIEGMSCASCVGHVDEALREVPGVVDVRVNLVTNAARVRYDSAQLDKETLAQAVRGAGYEVPAGFASSAGSGTPIEGEGSSDEPPLPSDDERAAREVAELRRDVVLGIALTVPLLALAMSHGALLSTRLDASVQFALSTLVLIGPGRRFFVTAARRLRRRRTDMNTLVALGSGAAWVYSTVALLVPSVLSGHHGPPHLYFEASGAILAFLLVGKYLEARTKRHLGDAVRALLSRRPTSATRVFVREVDEARSAFVIEREEQVLLERLEFGDLVLVRPGEHPATDGVLAFGSAALDESMLSGESLPVDKAPGSRIFAGTVNLTSAFVLRVERLGSETVLARIAAAVREAQAIRAPIADLADRVSAIFVPAVLALAGLTFLGWTLVDASGPGLARAFEFALSVLVIACPCALGLATPAAIAVATGRGAELGILVKGGAALEALSRVDTVCFDKTGTLTRGAPVFAGAEVFEPAVDEGRMFALVAAVEARSEHPIARAFVSEAARRGVGPEVVTEFKSAAGRGVEGRVGGRLVKVGTWAFVVPDGTSLPEVGARVLAREARGETVFFVAEEGTVLGLVSVSDPELPEAREVVRWLGERRVRVVVLSGDRPATVRAVASHLRLDDARGGLLPAEKTEAITGLRDSGRVVAMVGDGINDAPALAAADVGIALGGGTDVALGAADVALLRGGLARVPTALSLGRAAVATIRQNLFWAFAYNVVGLPLAAGLFAPLGWTLSPIFASAAMSLSSVSVLLNSLRLRRVQLDDGPSKSHDRERSSDE